MGGSLIRAGMHAGSDAYSIAGCNCFLFAAMLL